MNITWQPDSVCPKSSKNKLVYTSLLLQHRLQLSISSHQDRLSKRVKDARRGPTYCEKGSYSSSCKTNLRATGHYLPYGLTPVTRHKWTCPALTPARQAGTRLLCGFIIQRWLKTRVDVLCTVVLVHHTWKVKGVCTCPVYCCLCTGRWMICSLPLKKQPLTKATWRWFLYAQFINLE